MRLFVRDLNTAKGKRRIWAAAALYFGAVGLVLSLVDSPARDYLLLWITPIQICSALLTGWGIAMLAGISLARRRDMNALIEMGSSHDDFWILDPSGNVCADGGGQLSLSPDFRSFCDQAEQTVRLPDGPAFGLRRYQSMHGMTLIVADDQSAQDRETEALKQRITAAEDLVAISVDWSWQIDPGQTVRQVGTEAASNIHLDATQMIGKRLIEVLDVRRSPGDVRTLMRFIHDQEAFSNLIVPVRLPPANIQGWFRLSGRPVIDAAGGFNGFVGTATDVSAQHNALLMSDFETRAMKDALEAISEGLVLFDADDQFLMCNRRMANDFASMAHLLQPEATLESLFNGLLRAEQLALPDDAPREARTAIDRELERAQMRREFKGQNNRWYYASITRSADESIVAVLSDITRHKDHEAELGDKINELEAARTELLERKEKLTRLAESLVQARNQAETASRAKSEFLAAMGHELRTPLNAIIGFSEVMVSESLGALGNSRYREYSRDIQDSGRSLLTVINNILELSKADAGKMELEFQSISLEDLIKSSIRAAASDAAHVDIELLVAPDVQEIVVDPQKIKNMLINLIANAVKFTPDRGNIRITASREGDRTRIEVCDNGIGMNPDDIPKALATFKQVDSTLGRKFEGTGLGLPLALRYAQLHDGELRIESALGEGTRVIVDLPDKTPKAAVA